jgi:ELWxxDGT repeat protein
MKRNTARAMRRRLSAVCASCLACCWFLVLPLPGQGQTQIPYLVKDIAPGNQGVDPLVWGPAADSFVTLGSRVLYANRDQVWATDGTAAGTVQLAELPCGDCNGVAFLGTLGNLELFAQQGSGASLWRTDGTRAGTFKLASIGIVVFQSFVVLDGRLFFGGCAAAGCGLLRSDGTAAGTTLVAPVAPSGIGVWNGKMVFFAPQSSPEPLAPGDLWVSDGTPAGSHLLMHFAALQVLLDVTGVAGGVVFVANQGQGGELWTSDGTAAGTHVLTKFPPTGSSLSFLYFKALGGRAYFIADDGTHGAQLWRTDGTAAGTAPVTNLVAPNFLAALETWQLELIAGEVVFLVAGPAGTAPWRTGNSPGQETPLCSPACAGGDVPALVKAGSRLFFLSIASLEGASPGALWVTDGTAAGTARVAQVCPGGCDAFSPLDLVPLGGTVYFEVTPPASGSPRLWASDGTAAGTRLVSGRAPDLSRPGGTQHPGQPPPLGARGARLFFAATDDSGGEQVWVSDGTPGSERQLTDLVIPSSSLPASLVAAGDHLFFLTGGPYNFQDSALWQSDGTGAGTLPVPGALPSPVTASNPISAMTAVGGMVFYLQGEPGAAVPQLWRADGTAGGTLELTAFPASQVLSGLAASPPGSLYFAVQTAGNPPGGPPGPPAAIWKSDGTPQGTVKAFDLPAGTASPSGLAVIGGALYFTAVDAQGAHRIWRSDGTAAGTLQLTAFAPEAGLNPYFDPGFTALGSRVFFIGLAPQPTLWVTDGTPSGTNPVAAPPLGPLAPFSLTAAGNRIFMLDHDSQLWSSDGTAPGTAQVSPDCCLLPGLVALGDRVFFKAAATSGTLLLSSDGTAAGTVPVFAPAATVFIGAQPLVTASGRVFFTADDGVHGLELWQTDGTAQGTRMVDDLAPGEPSSSPAGMTQAGGLLFFSADDGQSGDELWALPLAAGPACRPSDAWLCLLGGRFRVEATWRDAQGNSNAGHAVTLTEDTGWFWFFGPDSVEVLVKVLDGTALDGHVWVFYGALSNVEYALTVTDTLTGVTRRYENPPGQLASVADTHAFGRMGAVSNPVQPSRSGGSSARADSALGPAGGGGASPGAAGSRDASGSCQAGATRLCLQLDRFAVTVAWRDPAGHQGVGTTVPLTSDTGAFWFFAPTNVELVVKVLDGRAVNGKFWVFYGALSDVDYTLTVTDTATGAMKTYHNPAGHLASVADTSAF